MREREMSFLGYPGYIAREDGTIVKPDGDIIIAPYDSGQVTLKLDVMEYKTVMLNRIIAECFVENLDGWDYVRNIDGNKYNCKAENIEWVPSRPRRRSSQMYEKRAEILLLHTQGYKVSEIVRRSGISWPIVKRFISEFEEEIKKAADLGI